MHTPLLFRKSTKSCRVRNFTAGDCTRLATLDTEAAVVDGGVASVGVGGVDGEGSVEDVDAAAEDGLGEATPVSAVAVPLDSAVVWLSLLVSIGSGTRERRPPRPRNVRRKL